MRDDRGYPAPLQFADVSRRYRGSQFTKLLSHGGTEFPRNPRVSLSSSSVGTAALCDCASSVSLLTENFTVVYVRRKAQFLHVFGHIEEQILTATDICWVKEETYIL